MKHVPIRKAAGILLAATLLLSACDPAPGQTQPTTAAAGQTGEESPVITDTSAETLTDELDPETTEPQTESEQTSEPADTDSSVPGTETEPPAASDTTEPELLPPVEQAPPEIGYNPAFEGQTRAPGLRTETPYNVTVLTEGLNAPWGIAALPDGRLVISEKNGTMRIASIDGELSDEIAGFPELDTRNQGGLLDIEPAPDFVDSRLIYFTFSELTAEGSATAVGRARLSDDEATLENFETLFTAGPYYDNGMHFGSRLVFTSDGNMFVSTGERSDAETRIYAQDTDNGYGKILYLTAEGAPVEGAPWIDEEGAWPEIYTYGHRNVQGVAIHPETGELWVSEMGPRGGDELNLIKPGLNYGWPVVSYGIEYSGAQIGDGITSQEGMEEPLYYWDPVLAPSGMTFYASDAVPEWENNLFITGLRGQHIARIVLDGSRVAGEERILDDQGERFRDVEELDGVLYAVTDSGKLYKVGP